MFGRVLSVAQYVDKLCTAQRRGVHKRVLHLCMPFLCTGIRGRMKCYTGTEKFQVGSAHRGFPIKKFMFAFTRKNRQLFLSHEIFMNKWEIQLKSAMNAFRFYLICVG